MSDDQSSLNSVIEKVDPNPPIQTLSKTVLGALLVLSVFVNLLQGGCKGWKEENSYTKEQYREMRQERDNWKIKSEACDDKYNHLRGDLWFLVDSVANVRMKQKIEEYFQIRGGKNSIIIKPDK